MINSSSIFLHVESFTGKVITEWGSNILKYMLQKISRILKVHIKFDTIWKAYDYNLHAQCTIKTGKSQESPKNRAQICRKLSIR